MDYSKVPQEITNIVGDNVKLLAQLFPSAVKDGQVDLEALKEELGQFEEVGKEKYELTWAGKQDAKKKAQEDIYNRTLKYIEADSINPETTENLYIEGDNLEVLKLLRQNYYGAIKMIYIDPPYNTGNDFVYNDKFTMGSKESDISEGVRDDEGNPLQRNLQSSNRYHANWLNMMYSRVKMARDLLNSDGLLIISINDCEVVNLVMMCDEIFGANCKVAQLVWKNKYGAGGGTNSVASIHEYILIYSKEEIESIACELSEELISSYSQQDEKYGIRGGYVTQPLASTSKGERVNLMYSIEHNDETIVPPKGGRWIWSKEKFDEAYKNNEIVINKTTNGHSVRFKQYLKDKDGNMRKGTQLSIISNVFNQEGTKEFAELMGDKTIFDFPKPTKLIKGLLNLEINGKEDKNAIILDFFSGSGSTADAVMQLNSSDNGKRKFIMVQFPEVVEENTQAMKHGYVNICEIGKERILRAGEKIKQEIESSNAQLKIGEEPKKVPDIGFKVFRTADTNIKWNLYDALGQLDTNAINHTPDLADFTMGFTDIDVVYEVMLRQKDVPLSSTLETLTDIGNRTYLYGSAYLVCLETNITEELIDKLAALDPLPIKFIFRDSAFKDDINLKDETFRRLKNLIERNSGLMKKTYTVEFI